MNETPFSALRAGGECCLLSFCSQKRGPWALPEESYASGHYFDPNLPTSHGSVIFFLWFWPPMGSAVWAKGTGVGKAAAWELAILMETSSLFPELGCADEACALLVPALQ